MYSASPTNQRDRELQSSQVATVTVGMIGRIVCFSVIAVWCVSLVGCGPSLNISRDVELAPGEIKSIILDAVETEQTVNIEASAEHPFRLHIYLMENEAALDAELARGTETTKALAASKGSESHTVSATVPGGKEAGVRLEPTVGEDFSVKLNITN